MMNNDELAAMARLQIEMFCEENWLVMPDIQLVGDDVEFGEDRWTGQYLSHNYKIMVKPDRCVNVGNTEVPWMSWPGSVGDRTVYGILFHEFGHHVDKMIGERIGGYASEVRAESGERQLHLVGQNDSEWFADMMRLWITNPDLLRIVRPKTWGIFGNRFVPIINLMTWRETFLQFGTPPRECWDAVEMEVPMIT